MLDHTADVRYRLTGNSFSEILRSAAAALNETAFHRIDGEASQIKHIQVGGDSYEEVVVRWLQELIYLMDVEQLAFVGFTFDRAGADGASAAAAGYHYNLDDRETEIKGAPFHGLTVNEHGNNFTAEVILDL
jgi:SHS2 domain-containing protein